VLKACYSPVISTPGSLEINVIPTLVLIASHSQQLLAEAPLSALARERDLFFDEEGLDLASRRKMLRAKVQRRLLPFAHSILPCKNLIWIGEPKIPEVVVHLNRLKVVLSKRTAFRHCFCLFAGWIFL
jgi:hypothetical protein